MTATLNELAHISYVLLSATAYLAAVVLSVILAGRILAALLEVRRRLVDRHYQPVVERALHGDPLARQALSASPSRHQLLIARLLILPLIDDRDPQRVAETRAILEGMSFIATVHRYLRSRRSWRRALALHVLGLLQARDHTAEMVTALDDPEWIVRSAALDALTDLQDPAALPAIVVRLHDDSLPHGRRISALTAFGSQGEPLILDLMTVDPKHAVNYAQALALCGTHQSRSVLCRLTTDPRPDVCAAAFKALAHIGLNETAAGCAVAAFDSTDPHVRAAAAGALRGWTAEPAVVRQLANRLDDQWEVAVRAAQSLRSMGAPGLAVLQARAERQDTAGGLARYMLWLGPTVT